MKIHLQYLLLITFLFSSCLPQDNDEPSWTVEGLKPIYLQVELDSIYSTNPINTENLGKIVYKQPHIFINERFKGIHVIDNSNPNNPENIVFWQIPGNIDFTIAGDVLYADNTRDLYVIDIADIDSIQVLNHIENIYQTPSSEQYFPRDYFGAFECVDIAEGIVIDWELTNLFKPKMLEMKKIIHILFLMLLLLACSDEDSGSLGSSEASGTLSGSYANMLVISGFLYVVSDSEIITYDISDPTVPVEIDRKELGFGVESLLHRSGILFIGSQEAMFIYQINPQGIPIALSRTDYGVSFNLTPCDPIVANDTMAVASLSSRLEGICTAININELRFYNIENLEDPVLFKHMEMEEPKGMALVDNLLFVCEAENGLKVLDISDSNDYEIIYHYPSIRTFDVIPTGDILLVVGPESLFEFNYSDAENIYFIGQFDF